MTVDDVRAIKDDFITAAQAASVMRMDVSRLVGYAKEGKLPFPAVMSGNRVKISRKGFLAWCDGKEPEQEEDPGEQLMAKILERMEMIEKLLMRRIEIDMDRNMLLAGMQGKEGAQ